MSEERGYVNAEYLQVTARVTKHVKTRSYALMNIRPGHRVLDLGCGPATDTVALAQLVGEEGRVVGVDWDQEMVAEAADLLLRVEGMHWSMCLGVIDGWLHLSIRSVDRDPPHAGKVARNLGGRRGFGGGHQTLAAAQIPLPVEVIPMACRHVARELEGLGGRPVLREGLVTDNGNSVIDVHGLSLTEPAAWEERLNHITGVVANGLFCRRPADRLVVAGDSGLKILE